MLIAITLHKKFLLELLENKMYLNTSIKLLLIRLLLEGLEYK